MNRLRGSLGGTGLLLLPAGLALGLTLAGLGSRSLWLDEGASIAIASQHGAALWSGIAHDGGNMLAYYLGLHLLIASVGDAISVVRLPSALFAALTVALVADLASTRLGRRAGLIAGALAAVSLPLVFWGQDARGYAAMIALVSAAFWALERLVRDGRPRWWATYVLAAVLSVLSAIPAALVLPAQGAILLARRERRRSALLALALVAAGCVPVVVLAARRGADQLFWVAAPTWNEVGQTLRWLASAGMPPNFHATWASLPLLIATLCLLAGIPVLLLARGPGGRGGDREWLGWVVALWLLVPLALDVAESLAGQPVLLTRNSLVSLPAVALGASWVLTHPRLPVALGWGALAALLVLRAAVLLPSYDRSPEDWHRAAAFVLRASAPADCIAFYPEDGQMPFGVYVRKDPGSPAPRAILPAVGWERARPFVERYRLPAPGATRGCGRVWLVASHAGQRHGPAVSRWNLSRLDRLRGQLSRAFAVARARRFGWAAAVDVTLYARRGSGT